MSLCPIKRLLFVAPASADWMGKESSEKKVAHLKKELLLTDGQTSQVKAICDETMEKMKALHKEKEDRINALLTPEQREKYAAEMKEWKEKRHKDKDDDHDDKD